MASALGLRVDQDEVSGVCTPADSQQLATGCLVRGQCDCRGAATQNELARFLGAERQSFQNAVEFWGDNQRGVYAVEKLAETLSQPLLGSL